MSTDRRLFVPPNVAEQNYEFSWWKAFLITSVTCIFAFPYFFWMGTLRRAEPTDEAFHNARGYVRGSIAGLFGAPLFLALMAFVYYGNARDVGAFFNLEPYASEKRLKRENALAEQRALEEKLDAEERLDAQLHAERVQMAKKIAEINRQTEIEKSAEFREKRQLALDRQQAEMEKKREEKNFEDARRLAALEAERRTERMRKEAAEEEFKRLEATNRAAKIIGLKEQLVQAKKNLVAAEERRKNSESAALGITIRIKNLTRTRDSQRALRRSTEGIDKEIAMWEQKRAELAGKPTPEVDEVAGVQDEIQRIEKQLRDLGVEEEALILPEVNPFKGELKPNPDN
jgi:hypothetical protein